jgi:hypothetical protein
VKPGQQVQAGNRDRQGGGDGRVTGHLFRRWECDVRRSCAVLPSACYPGGRGA